MLPNSRPLKIIETGYGKIYIYPPKKVPAGEEIKEYCRRVIECLVSSLEINKVKR